MSKTKANNMNIKEETSANIFAAVIKDLEAKESKTVATIQVHLHNPAGDVIDEIITLSRIGAGARAAKQFLLDKFTQEP